MTRSIEGSSLKLGLSQLLSQLSLAQLHVSHTPRDELQSKAAEVATIAEEAKSSLGSQTELRGLLEIKEAEKTQAARALAAKEEERTALESRCGVVCLCEK